MSERGKGRRDGKLTVIKCLLCASTLFPAVYWACCSQSIKTLSSFGPKILYKLSGFDHVAICAPMAAGGGMQCADLYMSVCLRLGVGPTQATQHEIREGKTPKGKLGLCHKEGEMNARVKSHQYSLELHRNYYNLLFKKVA